MIAVVDTNVVAYHLLSTSPFDAEAGAFLRRAHVTWAPGSWRVELLNVLWMAVRAGGLRRELALELHTEAGALIDRTVAVDELAEHALELACAHDHPAYDTVFVALALREGVPLATFDQRLLARFPRTCVRPVELHAGA